MNCDYCDITLILDESGSMLPLRNDTIGGVNRFLAEQRKLPGKCVVSVVKFNHDYQSVYLGKLVGDAPDLTPGTYAPGGSTALLDAVGWSIDEAGSRLKAMDEKERPGKVIVVIVTDGEENSSKTRTKTQVKEAIERQQNQYKWEFVFLGANVDAFAEAGGMGIGMANTLQTYPTSDSASHAYMSLTANTTQYRSGRADTMVWTDQQRADQEKTK